MIMKISKINNKINIRILNGWSLVEIVSQWIKSINQWKIKKKQNIKYNIKPSLKKHPKIIRLFQRAIVIMMKNNFILNCPYLI